MEGCIGLSRWPRDITRPKRCPKGKARHLEGRGNIRIQYIPPLGKVRIEYTYRKRLIPNPKYYIPLAFSRRGGITYAYSHSYVFSGNCNVTENQMFIANGLKFLWTIHLKAKNCRGLFVSPKNWRKKCANLDNKILRQKVINHQNAMNFVTK